MKSLFLRSSLAIACAFSLAACGGGSGSLVLGGQVVGLTKTGLVLQNNGGGDLVVEAGASTFAFPDLIENDANFNVTIKATPVGTTCTVTNGKGKSGAFNVTSVVVTCQNTPRDLGGKVQGLTQPGLDVINGNDQKEIAANATSFAMNQVPDGLPYGITILHQPTAQACSIANGTGTMGEIPPTNILITCQ